MKKADVTFMKFAWILAERATCERRQVGAVVTDSLGLQVLGIGYNGNARGLPNNCDRPEIPGDCGCIHAEANALLKAPGAVQGKILYTTDSPCFACAKLILNAGIDRVVYGREYRFRDGVDLLAMNGVVVEHLELTR